jgi:hypothetical protein
VGVRMCTFALIDVYICVCVCLCMYIYTYIYIPGCIDTETEQISLCNNGYYARAFCTVTHKIGRI